MYVKMVILIVLFAASVSALPSNDQRFGIGRWRENQNRNGMNRPQQSSKRFNFRDEDGDTAGAETGAGANSGVDTADPNLNNAYQSKFGGEFNAGMSMADAGTGKFGMSAGLLNGIGGTGTNGVGKRFRQG